MAVSVKTSTVQAWVLENFLADELLFSNNLNFRVYKVSF